MSAGAGVVATTGKGVGLGVTTGAGVTTGKGVGLGVTTGARVTTGAAGSTAGAGIEGVAGGAKATGKAPPASTKTCKPGSPLRM
ncbi:MAG: hypothetical protein EB078_11390 [Proteobacteria bacterium]|nr:hypothetical protein [Pseudomonadota bacterium]